MQCQAITRAGFQCSRNADPRSIYCWQHQGYTESTIIYPEFKESKLSPRKVPSKSTGPFFNEEEFKQINSSTTAKINDEEGALDYKQTKSNQIIARGPLKIDIEVGEAEPVVLGYELDLPAGEYTYKDIIDAIRKFFNKKVTHKQFFDLIRLSDEFEDESARELYSILQEESAKNTIKLYDLMGSSIYIEGIKYDTLLKKYYLILGS